MKHRDTQEMRSRETSLRWPALERPHLGEYFEPHGAFDDKLLTASDKVTYTFISGEEVISLHFDKKRQCLFYNGHSLDNIEFNEEQQKHLEHFREALSKNPETSRSFLKPFDNAITHYLKLKK